MVEEKVFGEYGRKKLLMYADSFLDLANSFAETEQAEAGNMPSEGREKMLKEHSLRESMQVLKDNLSEVSQILQKVAEETAVCIELPERQKKKVIRMLGK